MAKLIICNSTLCTCCELDVISVHDDIVGLCAVVVVGLVGIHVHRIICDEVLRLCLCSEGCNSSDVKIALDIGCGEGLECKALICCGVVIRCCRRRITRSVAVAVDYDTCVLGRLLYVRASVPFERGVAGKHKVTGSSGSVARSVI